jgi:hypothetical protein
VGDASVDVIEPGRHEIVAAGFFVRALRSLPASTAAFSRYNPKNPQVLSRLTR